MDCLLMLVSIGVAIDGNAVFCPFSNIFLHLYVPKNNARLRIFTTAAF